MMKNSLYRLIIFFNLLFPLIAGGVDISLGDAFSINQDLNIHREGKDDIKANLAKNEFVFTADAVRGAGDGDIEKGAQRMYDTMKRLEGRIA